VERLTGKVKVHTKKKLGARHFDPGHNRDIRVVGGYLDGMIDYILEDSPDDRIVVARTTIASEVEIDLKGLVGELYLKSYKGF